MKKAINEITNYGKYLVIFILTVGLVSCSNDDDVVIPDPDPTGTITVSDQTASQNTIRVSNIDVDQDSWLVVRQGNDLIADPIRITEGSQSDVVIQLDNSEVEDLDLQDGATITVQLYADDGDGSFDSGDAPIMANGTAVSETIIINSPSFAIDAETDVEDNTITFQNVSTSRSGWIVIYNQDEEGNINQDQIVGRTYVPAGVNEDVVVTFDETFTYDPGQTVFSRIHIDDPDDEDFTFQDDPNTDVAETFGFNEDNTITGGFVIN